MTATEWLQENFYKNEFEDALYIATNQKWFEQAKEREMQNAISFHKWMKREDHVINSEKYFHFSDKDMYNEYLKQAR